MTLGLFQGTPRSESGKTVIPIALIIELALQSSFRLFWARPIAVRVVEPGRERVFALLRIPGAERRLQMQSPEMLKDIADNLKSSASVDLVFGSTREAQGKSVIPIASVQYAFGAGSGEGTETGGEGQKPKTGKGGGGGGGVKAHPVAVIEITPDETRVIPVMDYTRLASKLLAGIIIWWILRSFRRR